MKKRIFSIFTAFALLFSTLPVNALAVGNADTGGLCEHHPAHTAECGYTGGAEGTPCNHEHTEDCYVLVEKCVHEHTEDCYPADSVSDNTATPSDVENREPTECTHVCGEDTGCIKKELNCQHEHSDECGYAPATEGTPCGFVCEECNAESSEQEKDACICDAPCTEEAVNTDCPVCGMDGADLTLCKGEPEQAQNITITSFDELPEEVQTQIIPAKTKLADLNLPDTLGASGYVGTQDSGSAEPLTIEGVTWESDPAYDENTEQGAWLFTAVLPENYALLDGVELPRIGVMAEPANLLGDTVVVDYLDCNENGKNWTTKQANATLLDRYTTSLGADDGAEHWYVVRGTVSFSSRITVTGDVHLILEDEATLTAVATVQDDDDNIDNGSTNKLTIYAQSESSNTGKWIAMVSSSSKSRASGIGGINGHCGEITINGGIIEAKGGSNLNIGGGPGIGGGGNNGSAGSGGNITINGGKVTATGGYLAAGIGGPSTGTGGNIIINGGEIIASGGVNGAGIGGGQRRDGGETTIRGGEVIATGGDWGAGIGGGSRSSGGAITISGGIITANGSGGAGIGDGQAGSGGTFSTVSNGNAVIFANSISDQSGKDSGNWNGVIFEGDSGQVYGKVTRTEDFEIPDNKTLTIPKGNELYLTEGATMTNRGAITVGGSSGDGLLDYTNGVINNYKDISGSTITPADESWNNQESELRFTTPSGTATYGGSYDLTVQVSEKPTNGLLRAIPKKTVYFYQGDTLVGSAEVDDITKQATLSIKLEGAEWNAGNHTLRASYTGSNDQLLPSETTSDFSLNIERREITNNMVELSQTEFTYDGQEKTPTVNFTGVGATTITAGTDYTVNYTNTNGGAGNRTNAGTVTVTIEGCGNYTGNVEKNFTIQRAVLTAEGSGAAAGTYGAKLGDLVTSWPTVKWNTQTVTGTWAFADSEQILGVGKHTCPATFTPQIGPDNYEPLAADIAVTINKNPAPPAPTVTGSYKVSEDKTKFVYTVNAITGAEYSKDGSTWQDSPVFDGIEPDAEIIFYARLKETDSTLAGYDGNTGKVIFSKLPNNEKPPLSVSITGEHNNRTVTIAPVAGAEYSFNDGAYSSSNEKTGCSGYVKVAIRYAETATLNASGATEESVNTDKQAQTGFAISSVGSKTYGDAAFTLSTTGGSGTGGVTFDSSNPSVLTISGSTATIHKAGSVTITATKAADNDYNEAVAILSLTIGERPITVTADSFTVLKGAAMPTLTWQITSGSLAGTDRFTTPPTLSTVKDTNTVGEHDITISGGVLDNGDSYRITYAGGKLIVTDKTPVQLTLTANPATLSGGGSVTLTLTGLPSGGTATVSCSDSNITVSGGGTSWKATLPNETAAYTFTANYSGDAQHTSAEAACTVSVTRHTSGGDDGNSGGNSGGGNTGGNSGGGNSGGSTIIDRPTEKHPDIPTTSETKPVKPDKDGNVSIGGDSIQDAINKAAADAKKNGNKDKGIAVTVPVNNAADAGSLTITIPAGTLDQLVAAKVRRFDITTNGLPCFSFTLDTLEMLDKQSLGGDLILRLTKTTVTSKQAKEAIDTRPAYDIALVFIKDGKETPFTDWQGKTVSVKLPYTPAKDEQAGNLYAVYVDAKGKVEWLTKSSYNADQKAVIFETGHFSVYGVGYKNPAPVFTDITGHWAADNIIFVASRGLLAGTGNNKFSPNTGMTRGMFVTALGRLAGIDPESYKTGKFTDVKADAYYAPYVNWAAEKGIVSGTSATTFSPDTNITREQMAVIMASYAEKMGYDLPVAHEAVTFADNAQISSWAAKEVKAMQQAGIMAGKGGNRFDPKGTATRAEVATVLRRFVEIVIDPQAAQGWMQDHSGSWQYMKDGKAVTGWLYDDKKWYWLDKNGRMFASGWKQIDGKWYYFYSDGSMAVNTTIDGHTIGPDGARK